MPVGAEEEEGKGEGMLLGGRGAGFFGLKVFYLFVFLVWEFRGSLRGDFNRIVINFPGVPFQGRGLQ